MEITFDPAKDERNIRERGLSFERAVDFDFETAIRVEDTRRDYGETRFVAVGYLGNRLHVLCFTETETGLRVISFRRAMRERRGNMAKRKPLIGKDGEVRELTLEDFKHFRPAAEVLPRSLQEKLGMRRRGPQKAPTKERTTVRLSRDVLDRFRASGPGWQTRLDAALREWLESHPAD